MKFLLLEIKLEPYRLAKIQWILYKMFRIKPKYPCGHTKHEYGYFCHQPHNIEFCNIINDKNDHRIICKCCGSTRMLSSDFIDGKSDDPWFNCW